MRLKYILLPLIIAVANYSCDKIDEPYLENTNGQLSSNVVLIEFTGMKCIYCPQGHIAVEELKDLYGDKVQPIAIHAGDFAEPDVEFPADFRTDAGNTLFNFIEPQGFPSGSVNSFTSDSVVSPTAWAAKVVQQGMQKPKVLLSITLSIVDSTINLEINTQSTGSLTGNYRLCAYLTEDKVIGKQKDGNITYDDYEHNHMLRAVFGDVWGKDIIFGTNSESKFTMKLQENWNKDNLKVVPFILNFDTKEILPTDVNFTE